MTEVRIISRVTDKRGVREAALYLEQHQGWSSSDPYVLFDQSLLTVVAKTEGSSEILGVLVVNDRATDGLDYGSLLSEFQEQYGTSIGNTLALHAFCVHRGKKDVATIEEMLKFVFTQLPVYDNLIAIAPVRPNAQFQLLFSKLGALSSIFTCIWQPPPYAENPSAIPPAVYLCHRHTYCPSLFIRPARVEDCDDLMPVFRQQSDVDSDTFGPYFLADAIEGHGPDGRPTRVIVGEGPSGRAVAVMVLTDQVPVDLLQNCYDLAPYGNLLPRDPVAEAAEVRTRIIEARAALDWHGMLETHAMQLPGLLDSVPPVPNAPPIPNALPKKTFLLPYTYDGMYGLSSLILDPYLQEEILKFKERSSSDEKTLALAYGQTISPEDSVHVPPLLRKSLLSASYFEEDVSMVSNLDDLEGLSPSATQLDAEPNPRAILANNSMYDIAATGMVEGEELLADHDDTANHFDQVTDALYLDDVVAVLNAKGSAWGFKSTGNRLLGSALVEDVQLGTLVYLPGEGHVMLTSREQMNARVTNYTEKRRLFQSRSKSAFWYAKTCRTMTPEEYMETQYPKGKSNAPKPGGPAGHGARPPQGAGAGAGMGSAAGTAPNTKPEFPMDPSELQPHTPLPLRPYFAGPAVMYYGREILLEEFDRLAAVVEQDRRAAVKAGQVAVNAAETEVATARTAWVAEVEEQAQRRFEQERSGLVPGGGDGSNVRPAMRKPPSFNLRRRGDKKKALDLGPPPESVVLAEERLKRANEILDIAQRSMNSPVRVQLNQLSAALTRRLAALGIGLNTRVGGKVSMHPATYESNGFGDSKNFGSGRDFLTSGLGGDHPRGQMNNHSDDLSYGEEWMQDFKKSLSQLFKLRAQWKKMVLQSMEDRFNQQQQQVLQQQQQQQQEKQLQQLHQISSTHSVTLRGNNSAAATSPQFGAASSRTKPLESVSSLSCSADALGSPTKDVQGAHLGGVAAGGSVSSPQRPNPSGLVAQASLGESSSSFMSFGNVLDTTPTDGGIFDASAEHSITRSLFVQALEYWELSRLSFVSRSAVAVFSESTPRDSIFGMEYYPLDASPREPETPISDAAKNGKNSAWQGSQTQPGLHPEEPTSNASKPLSSPIQGSSSPSHGLSAKIDPKSLPQSVVEVNGKYYDLSCTPEEETMGRTIAELMGVAHVHVPIVLHALRMSWDHELANKKKEEQAKQEAEAKAAANKGENKGENKGDKKKPQQGNQTNANENKSSSKKATELHPRTKRVNPYLLPFQALVQSLTDPGISGLHLNRGVVLTGLPSKDSYTLRTLSYLLSISGMPISVSFMGQDGCVTNPTAPSPITSSHKLGLGLTKREEEAAGTSLHAYRGLPERLLLQKLQQEKNRKTIAKKTGFLHRRLSISQHNILDVLQTEWWSIQLPTSMGPLIRVESNPKELFSVSKTLRLVESTFDMEQIDPTLTPYDVPPWLRHILIASLMNYGLLIEDPTAPSTSNSQENHDAGLGLGSSLGLRALTPNNASGAAANEQRHTLTLANAGSQVNINAALASICKNTSNAACITHFVIAEQYASRTIEVLRSAFEVFPDKEYLLLTLPHDTPSIPLLPYMVQAFARFTKTLEHVLYLCHRDSMLTPMLLNVSRATEFDRHYIASLVSSLPEAGSFLDAVIASEYRAHLPMSYPLLPDGHLQHVVPPSRQNPEPLPIARIVCTVVKVDGQVVAAAIFSRTGVDVPGIRALTTAYEVKDLGITTDSLLGQPSSDEVHTSTVALLHFACNPIFLPYTSMFLRQLMCLYNHATSCVYRLPPSVFGPHMSTHVPAPILNTLYLLRPIRLPQLTPAAREERLQAIVERETALALTQPGADRLDTVTASAYTVAGFTSASLQDPQSLDHATYLFHQRLSAAPAETCNSRIVLIGASDAAIACMAELLLLRPVRRLPYITLVSPNGLPEVYDRETLPEHAPFLPSGSLPAHVLSRLPISSHVTIVNDSLASIHRTTQVARTQGDLAIPYDRLVLLPGLVEQTWHTLGYTSDRALPRGFHCLVTPHSVHALAKDIDALASHLRTDTPDAAAETHRATNFLSTSLGSLHTSSSSSGSLSLLPMASASSSTSSTRFSALRDSTNSGTPSRPTGLVPFPSAGGNSISAVRSLINSVTGGNNNNNNNNHGGINNGGGIQSAMSTPNKNLARLAGSPSGMNMLPPGAMAGNAGSSVWKSRKGVSLGIASEADGDQRTCAVLIYGNGLEALTALAAAMDRGIPGDRIIYVRPPNPEDPLGKDKVNHPSFFSSVVGLPSLQNADPKGGDPAPPQPYSQSNAPSAAATYASRAVAQVLEEHKVQVLFGTLTEVKNSDTSYNSWLQSALPTLSVKISVPVFVSPLTRANNNFPKQQYPGSSSPSPSFSPLRRMDGSTDSTGGGNTGSTGSGNPIADKRTISIQANVVICADKRRVDPAMFSAINTSEIVFDGHLIVDHAFRTSDPHVFGGGSIAKYSNRYGSQPPLSALNSVEVGEHVARSVVLSIEKQLPPAPFQLAPVQNALLLPRLKLPKMTYALLPGSLLYCAIQQPPPFYLGGSFATRTEQNPDGSGLRHTRIVLDNKDRIISLEYTGTDAIESSNLMRIVGKPVSILDGIITPLKDRSNILETHVLPNVDLIEYLREPWTLGLYHPAFDHYWDEQVSSLMEFMKAKTGSSAPNAEIQREAARALVQMLRENRQVLTTFELPEETL